MSHLPLFVKFLFDGQLQTLHHLIASPGGKLSAKLTDEERRAVGYGKSLQLCSKCEPTARIPHPPLRGTFSPGEGIVGSPA